MIRTGILGLRLGNCRVWDKARVWVRPRVRVRIRVRIGATPRARLRVKTPLASGYCIAHLTIEVHPAKELGSRYCLFVLGCM